MWGSCEYDNLLLWKGVLYYVVDDGAALLELPRVHLAVLGTTTSKQGFQSSSAWSPEVVTRSNFTRLTSSTAIDKEVDFLVMWMRHNPVMYVPFLNYFPCLVTRLPSFNLFHTRLHK
jgi:hypothetical protein